MSHRVAVTGMGVVTPIGCDLDTFREALFAGVSGVGPITLFEATTLATRIAAEVKLPAERLGFRDRKIAFALSAADQAWAAATAVGSAPGGGDGSGGGVSLGLGLELFSLDDMAEAWRGVPAPKGDLAPRLTYLQTPSDLCVHLISRRLGLGAPPVVHVSACAAGTDAIGQAFRAVAGGRRRFALAGGSDSMVNPLGIAGFCKLGATSQRNAEPRRASRPFDAERDGFVLGEGAAVIVLERLDEALARGAHIHAEVVGYGCSFDAEDITRPHPEGLGAWLAMRRALDEAGVGPEAVGVVNAHGTGTPLNDVAETLAIRRLLGARADEVPVCATKSLIGHLIAAAGAVEAVATVLGLEAGLVHPTLNLEARDPACNLRVVTGAALRHVHEVALSSSFGFGGQNASLVLERADAAR